MQTAIKDRIDFRINREQKERIKYAAELKGFKNLSEFVIYCAKIRLNKRLKGKEMSCNCDS